MNSNIKLVIGTIVVMVLLIGAISLWGSDSNQSSSPLAKQILAVRSDDWGRGSSRAKVTLTEYVDFECSVCALYYPILKELLEQFPNDLRVVTRYFPLEMHPNSLNAALAVEAAGKQYKALEMQDLLFEFQKDWAGKPSNPELFVSYAEKLGLDVSVFKKDAQSPEVFDRVQRDYNDAVKMKLRGTPTFFLNGEPLENPASLEAFKEVIAQAVKKSQEEPDSTTGFKVHEHADIKISINGTKIDLSQAKYQSTDEKHLSEDVHLHDGNGDVVHKHLSNVTLADFLSSIGIRLGDTCIKLDTGEEYCNSESHALSLYVNGTKKDSIKDYIFSDLDKILITYSLKDDRGIQAQILAVTDDACIYSNKCPERGTAPPEQCGKGLGEECE